LVSFKTDVNNNSKVYAKFPYPNVTDPKQNIMNMNK
jgi:hypothetical protein